ncbi:VOC family protein, partial [Citrobacter freundii]
MSTVIQLLAIPVAQLDRAIAFYQPEMQVSLRLENKDCADLAVF